MTKEKESPPKDHKLELGPPVKPRPKEKKVCSNPRIRKVLTRTQLKRVQRLAQFQCSNDEIGAEFGIDRKTVGEWTLEGGAYYYPEFVEAIRKGKDDGRKLLRSKQVELALDGKVTMLIWVGKQVLGQREVKALEVSKVNDELDILLDEASTELFDKPKKGKGKK